MRGMPEVPFDFNISHRFTVPTLNRIKRWLTSRVAAALDRERASHVAAASDSASQMAASERPSQVAPSERALSRDAALRRDRAFKYDTGVRRNALLRHETAAKSDAALKRDTGLRRGVVFKRILGADLTDLGPFTVLLAFELLISRAASPLATKRLRSRFEELHGALQQLSTHPPQLVTIARSNIGGYTPIEETARIERLALQMLRHLYPSLASVEVEYAGFATLNASETEILGRWLRFARRSTNMAHDIPHSR